RSMPGARPGEELDMSSPLRLSRLAPAYLAALATLSLAGCGYGPNVVWSPDGKSLALDLDGKMRLFNVRRGEFATIDRSGDIVNPTFSPDGSLLAYQAVTSSGDSEATAGLFVRDLRTNQERIL